MKTRSHAKPSISDAVDICTDQLTYSSGTSKTEVETNKLIDSGNIKSSSCLEDPDSNSEIVEEEDYNRLMNTFEHVSTFNFPANLIIEKLSKQLTQFTTSKLLIKTETPLWKKTFQKQDLKHYCRTIISLTSHNFRCTLLEKSGETFLAVQDDSLDSNFRLFPVFALALQFFERRQKFFHQFYKRFEDKKQQNKLHELSNQIIFLYHEYHKLRKLITSRKFKEEALAIENPMISKKDLIIKQMKQLRKKLNKK